jgi:hypothetical protein
MPDVRSTAITDPVMLIRINESYRDGMSAQALYEATRGVWVVGSRRESVKFACAVFDGVILEVFAIDAWHQAGTTPYSTRDASKFRPTGRWEFTGRVAPDSVRDQYNGRRVDAYFSKGNQNPIRYVNA